VPLLALALTVLGFWNARRTAAVVRVDVPLANLPAGLHGFTVAQISDVHVGRYCSSVGICGSPRAK
jgi:predicted MPP superfamily phosphohydrolase